MEREIIEKYLARDHKEDIKKAYGKLLDVIATTSLIRSDFYSTENDCELYIKPENLQVTGSFKIRGAYNKISTLSQEQIQKGIIASSAGNHAQGVAFSARQRGVNATIVMPNVTPLLKVDATKAHGAEVIIYGDVYDESFEKALEIAEREGKTFIHPFDDYDVICGQATLGLEILNDLPDVDEIFVPIGGGGLASGLLLAVKAIKPEVKVIGVIPEGCMAMDASLKCGCVSRQNEIYTCAEGVAVKQPGDLTFEIVKNYIDEIITVSEKEIMENVLLMIEKHKLVAEAAGAVSLAGLKKADTAGKKIVAIVSGGNIDTVTISSIVNQGMISRGRIMCFGVELPDKPGQLLSVASLLSKEGANVIELVHNQFKAVDRYSNRVLLEVTVETNGHEHIERVLNVLKEENFRVERIY